MTIQERVERYLADCAAVPWLARKHHPTAAGCLKQVPHAGDKEQAALIKAAFERAVTDR